MERPRASTVAWASLAAGVAIYDALAPEGDTMSEACWRSLERPVGKYATIGTLAITAAHLLHVLPPKGDPFHWLASSARRLEH